MNKSRGDFNTPNSGSLMHTLWSQYSRDCKAWQPQSQRCWPEHSNEKHHRDNLHMAAHKPEKKKVKAMKSLDRTVSLLSCLQQAFSGEAGEEAWFKYYKNWCLWRNSLPFPRSMGISWGQRPQRWLLENFAGIESISCGLSEVGIDLSILSKSDKQDGYGLWRFFNTGTVRH